VNTLELFERLKAVGIKQIYIDTTDSNFMECELVGYDGKPFQYRTNGKTLKAALGRVIEVQRMALDVPEEPIKLKVIKGKKK
jgi:hypothetical protein